MKIGGIVEQKDLALYSIMSLPDRRGMAVTAPHGTISKVVRAS